MLRAVEKILYSFQLTDGKAVRIARMVHISSPAAADRRVDDLVRAQSKHIVCDSRLLVVFFPAEGRMMLNVSAGVASKEPISRLTAPRTAHQR